MATIIMSAEKVIEAAKNTLDQIEKSREIANEKMIAHYIKDHTPGKIGKFFGRTAPTREQAIKGLCGIIFGFYPSQKGWGDKAQAFAFGKTRRSGYYQRRRYSRSVLRNNYVLANYGFLF
jgi:hypothetical protein